MAHGSHSSHDDKSLEQGYQEDNVNIGTLIKFLIGLAVFTVLSMGLMYGLKVALEAQAEAEDKATANPLEAVDPMSLSAYERGKNQQLLPPEPRVQAAPGFGVTGPDGNWISLENKAPQSEYWELHKQWDAALKNGIKDAKTGTVIALPIEEAKKKYLENNPPVREGATEETHEASMASETSAGRTPGATAHAMTEPPAQGAATVKKEGGAVPKPSPPPVATPAAKAAGAH